MSPFRKTKTLKEHANKAFSFRLGKENEKEIIRVDTFALPGNILDTPMPTITGQKQAFFTTDVIKGLTHCLNAVSGGELHIVALDLPYPDLSSIAQNIKEIDNCTAYMEATNRLIVNVEASTKIQYLDCRHDPNITQTTLQEGNIAVVMPWVCLQNWTITDEKQTCKDLVQYMQTMPDQTVVQLLDCEYCIFYTPGVFWWI